MIKKNKVSLIKKIVKWKKNRYWIWRCN